MKNEKNAVRFIAVLTALLLLPQFCPGRAQAYSPVGYPGSTYGNASQNFDGLEGAGTQGWVRQGVTWLEVKGLDLNTYADYSWRVRTKNKTYYNVYGPGLIAALEKGPFSLGLEYTWLRYPEIPDTTRNASLFGIWYYSIDVYRLAGKIGPAQLVPLALPLTSWGRLDYDLHGAEGSGSQGWIKQGVDWFSLGRGWTLNTYAAYNWRLRTKNRTYYDALGPSLGINCFNSGINVGLEYLWQRFPQLYTTTRTLNLYLTWFYEWNLKAK